MKRSPILAVALVATLFFVSCKNSGISGLAVPKDAAMVVHVNTSSLTSKLSWEDIKATNWFKEMSKDADDSLAKKLLENPEASGIDSKGDLVYFMKQQGKGGYAVLEGKLKDAGSFEKMLLNMNKSAQVQKDGDLKYINSDKNTVVSWTGSQFIVIYDAPFMSMMSPGGMRTYGEDRGFSADSLRQFTKQLLALKSDNSLQKDERFSDLLKENGDVHFWMNNEQLMSSMGSAMSMLKMGSLIQGMAQGYTLNFDDGKIVVKGKSHFGKEMAKLLDQFKTREVDQNLVNRIPSQNVIGAMAMNFDPAVIKEIAKAAGVDGMANGFLGDMGLTLDELLTATKGEFIMSVSDLSITKKQVTEPAFYDGGQPYTYTKTEPDMKFLFATSVNNKQTFDKLLGMMEQKMKSEGMNDTSKFAYRATNEWFAASNKKEVVDAFLAGGNNKVPFADKIAGHPFGMYIDLQRAMKSGGGSLSNASDSASYNASLNMWQDVLATGGECKNGVCTMDFTINLVDKSKNSLKQINEYADKMHAARQLRPKKQYVYDGMDQMDSVAIPPPPPSR
jgi:hypothetical protein